MELFDCHTCYIIFTAAPKNLLQTTLTQQNLKAKGTMKLKKVESHLHKILDRLNEFEQQRIILPFKAFVIVAL